MADDMLLAYQNTAFEYEYLDERTDDILSSESDFKMSAKNSHTRYRSNRSNGSLVIENINNSENEEIDETKKYLYKIPSDDLPLSWMGRIRRSLHEDFGSLCLLLLLYMLQGIPLGLIAAIPLVLSSKNVSYGQQAIFSFAHWPFRESSL
ncbi:unnamed protein product [Onchocerca ochengi]|uniref:HCO3_cotransp domain-containing protein n=1 Tax=Onchocerca ochengi TaxID=42157 RepID=A0A182EQG9_ONCOC|nr:unnamed protein product [Onchocerca ochengi]